MQLSTIDRGGPHKTTEPATKMTRDTLSIALHNSGKNDKSEKNGLDNPALVMGSKTSINPPEMYSAPPYSEKGMSKDVLQSVYVVPANGTKTEKEEEYDPYLNRNVKHPTTYWETLIHMWKASLGTGILAMPNAFHNAGFAVGTIGTLVIGFLCSYCIHILISTQYELCRRRKTPSMTYPATAEAAFQDGPTWTRRIAPYAPGICNAFLLAYQLGSCCIYVVFVASNIKSVMDDYIEPMDVRVYMVILLVPLILINWVRNLKYLAPFSSLANILTVISFAITAFYVFQDLPDLSTRAAVGSFKGMPLFFGTVLFAMEAIGVVMPLENEMDNPKRFGSAFGVLNCAMLPITILYTIVGFFGYLKYGENAAGSITLNLPGDQLLAQSVKLMLALSIFVTHALACYVAFDITWNQYMGPRVESKKMFWEFFCRTMLVVVTFGFAVAIPNLELFISLIGALCLSTMGLSLPAVINMLTFWDQYRGVGFILFISKNMCIILISVLGFAVGTSTSLHEIIEKFFH
ncbi:proton-coupled amino acid transporter-like protein CG1139 isoform X1 [Nilaparvata lugens]|uniref:proton-coupled amino acid transporter-like protein CG1139 isoform X1 n=2 Tax=Nilaparvata lugens TaxID=108931 RepID=UPI00193C9B3E|nr:proton-coupled amino acid transporter-like protein CG1139 isoform X1 [Nilaparvata lugens]